MTSAVSRQEITIKPKWVLCDHIHSHLSARASVTNKTNVPYVPEYGFPLMQTVFHMQVVLLVVQLDQVLSDSFTNIQSFLFGMIKEVNILFK